MEVLKERRRTVRIALVGRPSAHARENLEVWIVDLSTTGARIALGERLEQGSTCSLELPPMLGSLMLSTRVVWNGLFGGERTSDGERHFIYQCGLIFVNLSKEQESTLARALRSLAQRAKKKPPEVPRDKQDKKDTGP